MYVRRNDSSAETAATRSGSATRAVSSNVAAGLAAGAADLDSRLSGGCGIGGSSKMAYSRMNSPLGECT